MEKRTKLIEWIKTHKKQCIIAGISIAATTFLVLWGIKNRDELEELLESLSDLINSSTPDSQEDLGIGQASLLIDPAPTLDLEELSLGEDFCPLELPEIDIALGEAHDYENSFEVCGHIRNLPHGHHASQGKIEEARSVGIELLKGQTLVDSYMKGGPAA